MKITEPVPYVFYRKDFICDSWGVSLFDYLLERFLVPANRKLEVDAVKIYFSEVIFYNEKKDII